MEVQYYGPGLFFTHAHSEIVYLHRMQFCGLCNSHKLDD